MKEEVRLIIEPPSALIRQSPQTLIHPHQWILAKISVSAGAPRAHRILDSRTDLAYRCPHVMCDSKQELVPHFQKYYAEFPSLGLSLDLCWISFADDFSYRMDNILSHISWSSPSLTLEERPGLSSEVLLTNEGERRPFPCFHNQVHGEGGSECRGSLIHRDRFGSSSGRQRFMNGSLGRVDERALSSAIGVLPAALQGFDVGSMFVGDPAPLCISAFRPSIQIGNDK